MSATAPRALILAAALCASLSAHARSPEECAAAWGQATRSYGAQTPTPNPDDAAFKPACELEAKGDKPAARLAAVQVAATALAKQEGDACVRFMTNYIGATDPEAVCEAAGGDPEALKKLIAENVPPPRAAKGK